MLRADQRDEFRRFVAGDDGMMRIWANQAQKFAATEERERLTPGRSRREPGRDVAEAMKEMDRE